MDEIYARHEQDLIADVCGGTYYYAGEVCDYSNV